MLMKLKLITQKMILRNFRKLKYYFRFEPDLKVVW